ncbi:TetR/AcrR family transcriptional regulator [Corynebacterium pacaense]|uniref:TetR/AcrR family transcriptional regulator n=1 Tax=Corynebacterium pacaense TaxID=1816684 RepID=UPI0015C45087|nr:TetR/AcrR family transcriptional regulator [Corynebacterium pacaense]
MAHIPADVRREQLVDAAFQIIATQGIQRATTRRIAEAANASLALVHYCFESKDDLLLEVFKKLAYEIVDFTDVASLPADPAERAAAYIIRSAEWVLADPERAHAMYETTLWATRRIEGEVSMAATVYEFHTEEILRVLAPAEMTAMEEPVLRDVARLVLSLVDGLQLQWVAGGNTARFRRNSEQAAEMMRDHVARMMQQQPSGT